MGQFDRDRLAAERQAVLDAVLDGRVDRDMGLKMLLSTGMIAEAALRLLDKHTS